MFNSAAFRSPPSFGQLAADGEWEKAVKFSPDEFQKESEVRDYLGQRTEVAFEAFFDGAFFGVRRRGTPEILVRFILEAARAFYSSRSGPEMFLAIADSECFSLANEFLTSEIGAVNAWLSVGAFSLPDPISAVTDFDAIWETLQLHPVSQNSTHQKAIEFAFDNGDGTTHWFAFLVSSDAPPFEINRDKLHAALVSYVNCSKDR